MKRSMLYLSGLLLAQILLVITVTWSGSDYAAFEPREPLIAFKAIKIDKIMIAQEGGESVELEKHGEAWRIPDMANFPADADKVSGFLSKIFALKKGWPVATSTSAQDRFKVAEDIYERRISLTSGGSETFQIMLGSSPSFRRVHARTSNDDAIYSVMFATHEAPSRGDAWMDRNALTTPEDEIVSLSLADITLRRDKDGKLEIADLKEGEITKESALRKLIRAVARPAYDAIEGKGSVARDRLSKPDLQVSLERKDGTMVTLKYQKDDAGGAYLFTSSDNDYLFRVGESIVSDLVTTKRQSLVQAKEQENKPERQEQGKTPSVREKPPVERDS